MATTKVINDVIDLNQTGNTQGLKGCVGTTAQQPTGVEGALRTNTDLSSSGSASSMQFYKSTGDPTTSGWVTLTNDLPPLTVDYLVVAGGGSASAAGGGGGGAGGLRTSYGSTSGGGASAETELTLSTGTSYSWSVGAGGAGGTHVFTGIKGSDSTFDSITSEGGGYSAGPSSGAVGGNGGSGGGGACSSTTCYAGGSGTAGQGFGGGDRTGPLIGAVPSAGGGGAGGAAADVTGNCNTCATAGGVGLAVNILNTTNAATASVGEVSGSDVYYAGGGGGSIEDYGGSGGNGAAGGLGGGSTGAYGCPGTAPLPATPNTGGGGGAPGGCGSAYSTAAGSGVIILRYPSLYTATVSGTQSSGSPFTEGSHKITVLTSGSGTITFN